MGRSADGLLVMTAVPGRSPGQEWCVCLVRETDGMIDAAESDPWPTDPAALYTDVALEGSLAAALRAAAIKDGFSVPFTASESDLLRHAAVTSTVPQRTILEITACSRTALVNPRRRVIPRHGADRRNHAESGPGRQGDASLARRGSADRHLPSRVVRAPHRPLRGGRPRSGATGRVRVAAPAHGGRRGGMARVSRARGGGIRRTGTAGAIPVHEPLDAAILHQYPPSPHGHSALLGRASGQPLHPQCQHHG